MAVRLAINGFGRIGRLVLRAALARDGVEVVAVNHKSRRIEVNERYGQALAHSLRYDSVHGRLQAEVSGNRDAIFVAGREVKLFAWSDPAELPWRDLGVEIVVESTGRMRDGTLAARHITAGAKKVIITAPARNDDVTVVMGVNERVYDPGRHHVISNASCTTNCLAPVAKVLHRRFGIVRGIMNTVHAYTNNQQILDMPYWEPRRGRAAGLCIIPTTTGAARTIGRVLPELDGKLSGAATRVPVPDVSVIDLVVVLARSTDAAAVNAAFQEAAEGDLKGILAYTELPLVSSDFIGNPHSAIVDGLCTCVLQGDLARVVAWYDNEWAYANRVLDLAEYVAARGL